MNELKVFEHDHIDVVDSRQVAEMVEKSHAHLMRDIAGYAKILAESTESKFGLSDFFIPSTYKDSTGRTLPCYLLTKKGCDMVANKMTGEKGVLFTAAYVTAFEAMREHIKKGKPMTDYQQAAIKAQMRRMEIQEQNNHIKRAKMLEEMSRKYAGRTFEQILDAHATKELVGEFLIPLPEIGRKTYSAEEVGKRYGVTAHAVGRIANANGLKTERYGSWFADKAKHAQKEVNTFRYFDSVFPEIEKALGRKDSVQGV